MRTREPLYRCAQFFKSCHCSRVYVLVFSLLKDAGSSGTVEPGGSLDNPPDSGSPRRHFQEGAKEEQVS